MKSSFYNPKPVEQGYYYHVNIYQEALLTYGQKLEKEHGERPITSDPEDSTNYNALDWYKNGSMSFAEKEWTKCLSRLRENLKLGAEMMLQTLEGDSNRRYLYHFGSVIGLKGNFLIRTHFYITHQSFIEIDQERFMTDMTRFGRWDSK